MLDKSIPWHSFIMSREFKKVSELPALPNGFSIRSYRDLQDEEAWARIETAVGEFDSVEEAIKCHRNYLACEEELKKRQWFVVNEENIPVATATIWWCGEERVPCIHAWSCLPEYQHKGLGIAVAIQMLLTANELHPSQTVWLETQTWSIRAIGLYLRLGFIPRKEATFNETANDYELSLPLLKQKMDAETIRLIESLAR